MPRVICPKCGKEGWLIKKKIKGNWYLYVDHYVYDWEKLESKHVVHYLGAAKKFPKLAELVGLEVGSKVSSIPLDNAGNVVSSIPGYEEFMERVKELAEAGDEDAKKIMRRAKKDAATIKRVLALLSKLS